MRAVQRFSFWRRPGSFPVRFALVFLLLPLLYWWQMNDIIAKTWGQRRCMCWHHSQYKTKRNCLCIMWLRQTAATNGLGYISYNRPHDAWCFFKRNGPMSPRWQGIIIQSCFAFFPKTCQQSLSSGDPGSEEGNVAFSYRFLIDLLSHRCSCYLCLKNENSVNRKVHAVDVYKKTKMFYMCSQPQLDNAKENSRFMCLHMQN